MKLDLKLDPIADEMTFSLGFDARDAAFLVQFSPPGETPWMTFSGRKPSAILKDLALWAELLETRGLPGLISPELVEKGA